MGGRAEGCLRRSPAGASGSSPTQLRNGRFFVATYSAAPTALGRGTPPSPRWREQPVAAQTASGDEPDCAYTSQCTRRQPTAAEVVGSFAPHLRGGGSGGDPLLQPGTRWRMVSARICRVSRTTGGSRRTALAICEGRGTAERSDEIRPTVSQPANHASACT
jgi:hypothetical protein